MKNFDFRNAVIGNNGVSDTAWPVLNESNNPLKKRIKFHTASRNHNQPIQPHLPSTSETNVIVQNSVEKHQREIESNFPVLSESILMKKDLNPCYLNRNINLMHDIKPVCTKNNSTRRTRIPKFRKEISVPLTSFIKPPVAKKKSIFKKKNPEKLILSGNKLDRDRPVRSKGKSRLVNRKYLTQYKKDIHLSKCLKKQYIYDKNFHKAKCFIPGILNSLNEPNIEKLGTLFTSLHIKEIKNDMGISPTTVNQVSGIAMDEVAKTLLHSKKFRKYCANLVTPTLLKNVEKLIVRLRNLQDKQHAKDPGKTFAKRRYLCGFRETKRFILCDSVKAVIVATNLEIDLDLPSGAPLNEIIDLAAGRSIPIIYAGNIKQFGYWTLKKQKISIISILRYEGAEQLYNDVLESWEESKKAYDSTVKEIELRLPKDIYFEKEISPDLEQEIQNNILSKLSMDMPALKKDSE